MICKDLQFHKNPPQNSYSSRSLCLKTMKSTEEWINWEKNRKTFFDFLSSGLGINVSFFRLGQFEEVESELGSPEAGVEIGTG